jgi:hypothetical protein
MTCDDAPGAPRDAEGVDAGLVGLTELGVGERVGALLRDAEALDWDGLAVALPGGSLDAAARWSGRVTSGPGGTSVAGESNTTAATTAATTNASTAASATTAPLMRLLRAPAIPRPDCPALRAGT